MTRYRQEKVSRKPLVAVGAPVAIQARALLTSEGDGSLSAQLKLKNMTDKSISFARIEVCALGVDGSERFTVYHAYTGLSVPAGGEFGQMQPVWLSGSGVASFKVKVIGVTFVDGSSWAANPALEWKVAAEPLASSASSAGGRGRRLWTSLRNTDGKLKKPAIAVVTVAIACVAVLVVSLIRAGWGQTDTGDGYQITRQRIVKTDGGYQLVGRVKNTCGRQETLLISWKFYDSGGTEVAQAFAVADDIDNNEVEDVEATIIPDDISKIDTIGDEISSFRLDGVSFMKAANERLRSKLNELNNQLQHERSGSSGRYRSYSHSYY